MEANKKIESLKVLNFKGLDSFEMKDIGQFNLISGDNNVGKSSIIEALILHNNNLIEVIYGLLNFYDTRLNGQIIEEKDSNVDFFSPFVNVHHNSKSIAIEVFVDSKIQLYEVFCKQTNELTSAEISLLKESYFDPNQSDKYLCFYINSKLGEVVSLYPGNWVTKIKTNYIPFVPSSLTYGKDIIAYYSELVQKSVNEKKQFIKSWSAIVDDIENIEPATEGVKSRPSILVFQKGNDMPMPLSMFGEGTSKLFRILVEIIQCRNGKLMIDDIDTGIHYSRFQSYLKVIVEAAKRNKVQVFATTHSLECLKYFKEILEQEEMEEHRKDLRYFKIQKLSNGKIKSYSYGYDEFASAIDSENEIRGGK
jgi:AAA15 family ATPase/GTPase